MKKTLAEHFMEARGPVVEYEGLTVHGAVFRQVKKRGRFIVRFVKAVPNPVQTLRINIDKGNLIISELADSEAGSSKMTLRLDTSLDVVEVHYRPAH